MTPEKQWIIQCLSSRKQTIEESGSSETQKEAFMQSQLLCFVKT